MIAYSIKLFRAAKTIDDFVVVLSKEEIESGRIARRYGVTALPGGATRNPSFKNALDWIAGHHPDCEKVIENNAACPLPLPEHIDEMIRLLDDYDWAQTTLHLSDALGSVKDRMVNRDDFFLIQAPDAYRFREISPVSIQTIPAAIQPSSCPRPTEAITSSATDMSLRSPIQMMSKSPN